MWLDSTVFWRVSCLNRWSNATHKMSWANRKRNTLENVFSIFVGRHCRKSVVKILSNSCFVPWDNMQPERHHHHHTGNDVGAQFYHCTNSRRAFSFSFLLSLDEIRNLENVKDQSTAIETVVSGWCISTTNTKSKYKTDDSSRFFHEGDFLQLSEKNITPEMDLV